MTCNYEGVTVAGYEYRRFQTGAQPFWTPLRFPGQYHDEETDLLENWNRYYDPSIGRYLQPEPLLADPKWVKGQTQEGAGVYAYAYGLNNPLHFTDPDGRRVVGTADRNDWWNILQDVLWDLRSSQAVHDWFMACFGEDPLANDDEYRIHAPKSDWWCKARDVKAYTNWYVQETTLCRETLFDLPPAGPPGTQKRQLAETVMHELSHQVSLKTLDTPSYCGVSTQASQCSAEEAGQIGWNAVRR
ncbi:RHS repeat-associated core domain-containing protein [Stigmatella aurantiaca]|nr:RHS repeat-associated core domain-containing protein [Stigmatella aurantiaca]